MVVGGCDMVVVVVVVGVAAASAGTPNSIDSHTSGEHGQELRETGALKSLHNVVALSLAERPLLCERVTLGGE